MSWIKMDINYKLKIGEELLATFSDYPEGVGTLYKCIQINDISFTVIQIKHISTTEVSEIPDADRKTHEIPFSLVPLINLHRQFNFGRV